MPTKSSSYVAELDGLRGIAILLVMVHRFYPRADGTPWPIEAGWVGVDLFFVISGFLIATILLDTRDNPDFFRNFYARRVLRIFPLFYLFIGSCLLLFPLQNAEFLDAAGSRLWYLLQLGNVPESVLGKSPPYWLAPVWSLAIEEQFYLTFPLLVRAVSPRRLPQWLVGFAVLALVTRIATTFMFPANERIQYLFTLCRLDTIAAGCLLAVLVRRVSIEQLQAHARRPVFAGLVACALVTIATDLDRTTLFGRTLGYSVVALGFAALVLAVLLHRDRGVTAPLRFAPLRYLGKLCFGLYLLHRPADTLVSAVASHFGYEGSTLALVPVKIAAAAGLATLSWYFLELRFLRLKKRFSTSRALAFATILVGCTPAAIAPSDSGSGAPDRPDTTAPDASLTDASVAPAGDLIYPEGAVHSPITSEVVASLAAIAQGATMQSTVFGKVGDSITATTSFLSCFESGPYDLGTHGGLATTRSYFLAGNAAGTSPFSRASLAAHGGWTTGDELAGSPPPLDQEVTAITPRYAVVMLGTNDVRYGRTYDAAVSDLWTIVDDLRTAGTIPVLSTIPANVGDASADVRIPLYDRLVRALAQGRALPLVDYHLAMSTLANQGISGDGIHPTVSPEGACVLTQSGLAYGYNTRNLVTLEALDRTRRAVGGEAIDASTPHRTGAGSHADPFASALPLAALGDTRFGESTFAAYPCGAPGGGHEIVYRLDLAAATTIEAEVVDRGAVDVDVAILGGSLGPAACRAWGDHGATATVGPGPVFIVVDSRATTSEGEFLLVVQ